MLAVASGYWRTKALIYLGGEGGLRTKYWYSAVTWRRDHQKLSGSLSWSSAGGRRPAIMWWFVLTRSSELFVLCSLLVQIALARSVNWGHPHRSSALDGAAAALTVACTRVVAVPLSWSWSHHPQGRAWAAAPALVDTLGRTPYRTQNSLL